MSAESPRVEGDSAVFEWRGAVRAGVVGDFNDWNFEAPLWMEPVGRRLWQARLALPADAYMEYVLVVGGRRTLDPLNPRRVDNGAGKHNNFFDMPAATPAPFDVSRWEEHAGTLETVVLEDEFRLIGKRRRVHYYTPAAQGPMPLLVVLDGQDYLRRAGILQALDSLIEAGQVRPVALALVEHARAGRYVEYGCSDAFLQFLTHTLLPDAHQRLPLLDAGEQPGCHGILGASMGGLMALYAGLRQGDVFGRVLSQSGAFSVPWGAFSVYDLAGAARREDLRVWLDVGRFEWLRDTNLRMHALLAEQGCAVELREGSAGHNYTYWGRALPAGLRFLFPAVDQPDKPSGSSSSRAQASQAHADCGAV